MFSNRCVLPMLHQRMHVFITSFFMSATQRHTDALIGLCESGASDVEMDLAGPYIAHKTAILLNHRSPRRAYQAWACVPVFLFCEERVKFSSTRCCLTRRLHQPSL